MKFELTWPDSAIGFFELGERNLYPKDSNDTYYFDCGYYSNEIRTEGSSNLTITYHNVKPTAYLWNAQISDPIANDQVVIKQYWDDVLVETAYGYDDGDDNNYWLHTFYPPDFTSMGFYEYGNQLSLGNTSSFRFEPDYDSECNDTLVYPDFNIITDKVHLTITKGSEYITFYDENGNNAGSNIDVNVKKIDEFNYEYNRIYWIEEYIKYYNAIPGSEPYYAEVTAASNGIEETSVIELAPCQSDTIELKTQGDWEQEWINHGYKLVIPLVLDGYCSISEIENLTFRAEVTEGDEYGVLINPAVNPEKGQKKLTGVEHNNGYFEIVYYAKGTDPYQNGDVKITITSSEPNIAPLDIDFYIRPMDLVIEFARKDPSSGEQIKTGEVSAGETVEVKISRRGSTSSSNIEFTEEDVFPYIEIASNQYFELVDDRLYADLRGNDGTNEIEIWKEGDAIKEVTPPIYLTAKEDIDLDSINVRVYAEIQVDNANQSSVTGKVYGAEKTKTNNRIKLKFSENAHAGKIGVGYKKKDKQQKPKEKKEDKGIVSINKRTNSKFR